MHDPCPPVWCFVAKGYYHEIKQVTLENAEHYKRDGWLVVGPDPIQMAERVAWRARNVYRMAEDDGA